MAYMIRRTPYWRNQYEQLPSGFPLDVIENGEPKKVVEHEE